MAQRVWSPAFVGRGPELAAADGALARAATGVPSFLFVAGESGVGKSRLLAEIERRAGARGARVLVGHCLELGGAEIPYAPLVAALRPVAREAAGSDALGRLAPATRAALAEILPDLAADGAAAGAAERLGQGRIFEALVALLDRLAAEAPLVLVLEDLHWADPSTRDFVTYLVRSARDTALLSVVSYRSDELHRRHPLRPLLAELERAPHVERLELDRFTEAEAAEQLAGILGEGPDPDLLRRVFSRSQGNPLYTEELLAVTTADGCCELPASLADALLMRVERLTPAGQEVARVLAVADRPVHHELLGAVCRLPEAELLAGARDAVAGHVVVLDRAGRYAFRHALVGEAIYADLLPGERTALHEAIAEEIGRRPELLGDDVSELVVATEQAAHYAAAECQSKALAAAARAALAAGRVYAHSESLRQWDRVLTLWDRVPDATAHAGRPRVDVLLRASRQADWHGETQRALAYARQGAEEVDEQGDPLLAAKVLERLGHAQFQTGDAEAALATWDRGLALLPAQDPPIERVRLLEMKSRFLMLRGRSVDAVPLARQAAADARRLDAPLEEARALGSLGGALAIAGSVEDGLAALRRALELARQAGALNEQSRAVVNLTDVLDLTGRTAEALRTVDEGLAALRERAAERAAYDAFLALQGAWDATRLGRLREAQARLDAVDGYDNADATSTYRAQVMAELALQRGDDAEAARQAGLLQASALARLEPQWIGPLETIRAQLALRAGDADAARGIVRGAVEHLADVDDSARLAPLRWIGARAEVEAALPPRASGDVAAAREHVAVLIRQAGELPDFPEIAAYATLARGEVARLDRHADAAATFDAAAAAFEALGLAWPAAYARVRQAEALVEAGDRDAAGAALGPALAWATEADAAPLADEARSLARRARLALDRPAPDDAAAAPIDELGLTPRELEVLCLVADGRTNREIGATLYMSEKTASVHVSRILAKLGVRSRVEAAGVAHRLGLLATR